VQIVSHGMLLVTVVTCLHRRVQIVEVGRLFESVSRLNKQLLRQMVADELKAEREVFTIQPA